MSSFLVPTQEQINEMREIVRSRVKPSNSVLEALKFCIQKNKQLEASMTRLSQQHAIRLAEKEKTIENLTNKLILAGQTQINESNPSITLICSDTDKLDEMITDLKRRINQLTAQNQELQGQIEAIYQRMFVSLQLKDELIASKDLTIKELVTKEGNLLSENSSLRWQVQGLKKEVEAIRSVLQVDEYIVTQSDLESARENSLNIYFREGKSDQNHDYVPEFGFSSETLEKESLLLDSLNSNQLIGQKGRSNAQG